MTTASLAICQLPSPAQTPALNSWTIEPTVCCPEFLISVELPYFFSGASPISLSTPDHSITQPVSSRADPPGSTVLQSIHISAVVLFRP